MTLQNFIKSPYNLEYFKDFIQEAFPQAQLLNSPTTPYKDGHIIHAYAPICQDIELESSNILQVFAFEVGSTHAKITLHKELAKIAKNNASHILACFYDPSDTKEFRLSLITTGFDFEANKTTHSNLRRQSFVLGSSIPTHTAQKQLKALIDSTSKDKQALESAFSLEPVTKEFYKEIVGIFIKLIDSIQLPTEVDCHADKSARNDKNLDSSDNTKREFSLRLLSRLLFCKFLEKKGVIDQAIFSTTLSDSYYHEVLEPLFFSTLNTPRDARYYALLDPRVATLLDSIPYLNGGLFAPQKSDYYSPQKPTAYHTTLKVPNAPLQELFTLLEGYHFSIDESTPNSQEVGLNPELLGMVFESLLSELFTDNRKDSTSSLRKSTGSYYTPREIVQYMCRSSLYQFLLTKMDSASGEQCGSVANFVKGTDTKSANLPQNERSEVSLENLQSSHSPTANLRILEEESERTAPTPSLRGSGDSHNEAIHNQNADSSAKVDCHADKSARNDSTAQDSRINKNHTNSTNATRRQDFGDKNGALQDESRELPKAVMTAGSPQQSPFLAQKPTPTSDKAIHNLIFHRDPTTLTQPQKSQILAALSTLKVLDPACGSGAFPIGLLQELLELGEILGDTRDAYTRKLEILQSNIYGIDIQPMATEISRLRCFLSLILEEAPRDIKPLPNLEFKFLSANSLLPLPQDSTLEYDGYQADKQKLESIRKDNFNADLSKRESLKQDYLKTAAHIARNLILHAQGESPITSWNPYDPHSVAGFFDSEYMFGLQGFDIVIGNPPYGATYPAEHKPIFKKHYISARTINEKEAKRLYPNNWQDKLQAGSLNTYSLFIEQSYNLCATQGIVSLIVPMSVTASESMQGLHKLLLNNCETIWVSSYGDSPSRVFTNALIAVSIMSFIKTHSKTNNLYTTQINKRYKNLTTKNLLDNLVFTNSLPHIKPYRLPKISYQIEADILRKMYSLDSTIASVVSEAKSAKAIYYRSSGGRYYKLITTRKTHSNKEVSLFIKPKYHKAVGAFMSSTLYYWRWLINSNWQDNRGYEILDFPLPLANLSDETLHKLESIYAEYEADIERNATINKSGKKEYKIRKSKHIIDKIDRLICPLYGLSDEETEFIINYDLQFRTDD